jgi:hypothetical protein
MRNKQCFSLLFLLLTALGLFAQNTPERYAAKIARTSLIWPGITSRNETCGLQYIRSSQQINLVVYPSAFQWTNPNHNRVFLEQYMDATNHKSAHFDGTVTIQGDNNLDNPGVRNIVCQGNWTIKGISVPGTLSGRLEVVRAREIRISVNGQIQLNQFSIQPGDRSILDLPNATQVEISGALPGY